ncbi:DUF896 domain-containing protein [Paenibacillus sp. FA6]|uniref:DUF896 domain-containing protein n=1 Tax=Paenibacillus sp. FA6 TaxID=3413029 RepID=UPI003F659B77
MDIDNVIERINELARKKKIEALTEDEIQERVTLREMYLKNIRRNVRDQLDSIEFIDEDTESVKDRI